MFPPALGCCIHWSGFPKPLNLLLLPCGSHDCRVSTLTFMLDGSAFIVLNQQYRLSQINECLAKVVSLLVISILIFPSSLALAEKRFQFTSSGLGFLQLPWPITTMNICLLVLRKAFYHHWWLRSPHFKTLGLRTESRNLASCTTDADGERERGDVGRREGRGGGPGVLEHFRIQDRFFWRTWKL